MAKRAKEVLGVERLTNLADKGYYDGADILACEQSGIECLVAKPKSGPKKSDEFRRDRFIYDREQDCYVCPAQNRLVFRRIDKSKGKVYRAYENYAACRRCLRRVECTKNSWRKILRLPYQDVLDGVDRRTKTNWVLYRSRSEIVEHPFGVVKAVWGFRQFLCRGLVKVTAEVALSFLAYNFRRVFNIFVTDGARLAAIFSR
jgi:transposase